MRRVLLTGVVVLCAGPSSVQAQNTPLLKPMIGETTSEYEARKQECEARKCAYAVPPKAPAAAPARPRLSDIQALMELAPTSVRVCQARFAVMKMELKIDASSGRAGSPRPDRVSDCIREQTVKMEPLVESIRKGFAAQPRVLVALQEFQTVWTAAVQERVSDPSLASTRVSLVQEKAAAIMTAAEL